MSAGLAERLVFGLVTPSDASLSPDGRQALFTRTVAAPEPEGTTSELWLIELGTGDACRLTDAGLPAQQGTWSPDGGQIAFVSEGRLLVLDERGSGEPREIASHAGSIQAPAWSPDGLRLAYTVHERAAAAPDGTSPRVTGRVDYKRDGLGWVGDLRPQAWVASLDAEAPRELTSEPIEHLRPAWSPAGSWIAVGVHDWTTGQGRVLLIEVDGGERRPLGEVDGFVSGWAWSGDGAAMVLLGSERWTPQSDLYVYDVVSGAGRCVTQQLECSPDRATPPVWLAGGDVVFAGARAGLSALYRLDPRSGGDVVELARWEGTHEGLSVDRDGSIALQVESDPERALELVTTELASGRRRVVSQLNGALVAAVGPLVTRALSAQSEAGRIDAWLSVPLELDECRRHPVVLWVHGGPEQHVGPMWNNDWKLLSDAGFLVLAVNPRGSTSYGASFSDAVVGDWGPGPLDDLLVALDATLALPFADPDRVAIVGHSYGGYMTAWATSRTRRFTCAVAQSVIFDLRSQYFTGDYDLFYGPRVWGRPHTNPEVFEAQSPSTYAPELYAPTLILHGEEDGCTPVSQAEAFFRALKLAGCETELVIYPRAAHDLHQFAPAEQRVDVLTRTRRWLEDHLAPQAR